MVVRSADSIRVAGLADLRRAIRSTDQTLGSNGQAGLKDVNYKVADFVVQRARTRASTVGRLAASAARSMEPSRSGVAARINAGGRSAPFFGGAEFGAYRDKRRLLKNTRGRATLVRDEENIKKVIRRVEDQTLAYDRFGGSSTVRKRARKDYGATAVKVTGTMLGWNQFREWRGNGRTAGYFLFPTIRANIDEIVDLYSDEMRDLLSDVFPD